MFSIPSFESRDFYILCTSSLSPLLRVESFTSFVHVLYPLFLELRVSHPLCMFSIPSFESREFYILCTCSLFPLLRVSHPLYMFSIPSFESREFYILCTYSLFLLLRVESFTSFVHVLYSFFWELRVSHPLFTFWEFRILCFLLPFESWKNESYILFMSSLRVEFHVICYLLKVERMSFMFITLLFPFDTWKVIHMYRVHPWELSFMSSVAPFDSWECHHWHLLCSLF